MVVKIFPLEHNGAKFIGISFDDDKRTEKCVQELGNATWMDAHKCYCMELTQRNKWRLYHQLKENNYYVDYSAFPAKPSNKISKALSAENVRVLEQYVSYLQGKRYSVSTVTTYTNFVKKLIQHSNKPINQYNNRDIEKFIEDIMSSKNYAISTHRQCISAFKHFFVLHNLPEVNPDLFARPKKDHRLPEVLSREEVIDILRATRNLKHRAVLAMIYSAGLRIGEALDLKLQDMDIDRRQIIVKNGKGRKDRRVVMAEAFLPLLITI